jgi:DNA-binding CsgD family transcriptional regulator
MNFNISGNLALLWVIFEDYDNIDITGLKETIDKLREEHLSPLGNKILEMRFGLDINPPISRKKIGEILGISPEQVTSHVNKALRKLRHPSSSRNLYSFIAPFEFKYRQQVINQLNEALSNISLN